MPCHLRKTFLTSLLLALTLPACAKDTVPHEPSLTAASEAGMSAEVLIQLDGVMQSYVDNERLAGAVALVARKGQVVYLESFGYRDREAGDRLESDDLFRIASQTKALVSVGVMMLQEEGRLLISDPVSDYLPAFSNTTVAVPVGDGDYQVVPAKRPITLRDLLTHTSGIGYGDGLARTQWAEADITGWYFADRDEPIADTVNRMPELPFDAQPGERMVYGYSTDILGAVVEKVSGQSLDHFLSTRVLKPLQMNNTHFYLPENKRNRLVVVYSLSADQGLSRAPDPGGMVGQGAYVDGPRKSYSGGAGLLSTANDYGRFLQMMLNGGELDGVRLLSRKSVELMTVDHVGELAPPFLGKGVGFGLGFYVVTDVGARGQPGSVGEYGWGGAYHSTYWVDPEEELIVVFLSQLIPAPDRTDQGKLRALVYSALH
ncbi:MAG: serine hydrolase domain-containing protein [Lysobacterales bacterium]